MGDALFRLAYGLQKPALIRYYDEFSAGQYRSYEELLDSQNRALRRLVAFAYENVPFYRRRFESLGIVPGDIRCVEALQDLPVLTRDEVKRDWLSFIPQSEHAHRFMKGSTGGSTGQPLQYRLSPDDHCRGMALLFRGWGFGGYHLGDRLAMIGGSSLVSSGRTPLRKRVHDALLNWTTYSSYGFDESRLREYCRILCRSRPRFLRGYASSLSIVAAFVKSKGIELGFRPRGIFSTAERLLPAQRVAIGEAFGAPVFDTYGMHDGGLSAFECEEHCGMHVDMERSILEVVDDHGKAVMGRPGRVLATSLHNWAFPFIRYETGDIAVLAPPGCRCGRSTPIIKQVLGRQTETLELNGHVIGSPVLTVLFGKTAAQQYQIIQTGPSTLVCRIVKGPHFDERDEQLIRRSLTSHVGSIDIKFEYLPRIEVPDGQKHKFIINEWKHGWSDELQSQ